MILDIRWEVTEVHRAKITVPDDFDPDYYDIDDLVAEHEDSQTFQACIDRTVIDYKVIDPAAIPAAPHPSQEPPC